MAYAAAVVPELEPFDCRCRELWSVSLEIAHPARRRREITPDIEFIAIDNRAIRIPGWCQEGIAMVDSRFPCHPLEHCPVTVQHRLRKSQECHMHVMGRYCGSDPVDISSRHGMTSWELIRGCHRALLPRHTILARGVAII